MHRRTTALALALAAFAAAAPAAARAEDPQWVKYNGSMSAVVSQDTEWDYHSEFEDSCSANTIKYDGSGAETMTVRSIEGDNPVSIYMHARTGEVFMASPLGRPSGEGNSLTVLAKGATIRQGHIDTTIIGDDEPQCGGDPEAAPPPPPPDCGNKRHNMLLKIKFNKAFENITVRNALDVSPDPLYKNCPNYSPVKSPSLVLEFKRKQVNEGADGDVSNWYYVINGEAVQRTVTEDLTAVTRLKWRVRINRIGDYEWVAGPGNPWPVPPPEDRAALERVERMVIPEAPAAAPAPAAPAAAPAAPRRRAKAKAKPRRKRTTRAYATDQR